MWRAAITSHYLKDYGQGFAKTSHLWTEKEDNYFGQAVCEAHTAEQKGYFVRGCAYINGKQITPLCMSQVINKADHKG